MTVSTTASRVTYTGNSLTTVWTYAFLVPDIDDMQVVLTDKNAGTETTLSAGQYSVTGIGVDGGGTVTYPLSGPAIDVNHTLTIVRKVPYTQTVSLDNQDGFYPKVVEGALDSLELQIQQIQDTVSRSFAPSGGSTYIDVGGLRLTNLGAPTDPSDAVRYTDLQTAQLAAGNVPDPALADVGKFLVATAAHTWAWTTFTISNFIGDSGGNPGVAGLVPAPPSGAVAGKYQLLASGWTAPTPVAFLSGLVRGLKIQVTGDTGLTLAADGATVTDGTNYATLSTISLSLVTGSVGANALDAGTVANNTWYSVWVIAKSDGTTAGLLSTSTTSPTLPSGYTYKSRFGWVRTDGTAKLKRTLQYGRRAQYIVGTNPSAPVVLTSGTQGTVGASPVWVAVSVSAFVPPTASAFIGYVYSGTGGVNLGTSLAPNNSYPNSYNAPLATMASGSYVGGTFGTIMLESTNLYYASAGGATAGAVCVGWEDNF